MHKQIVCKVLNRFQHGKYSVAYVLNTNNMEQLETMKTELFELRQEKLKGHIIRSKSEYIDKGEKPTKLFCGLEKNRIICPKLERSDGTILNKQLEILSETATYYKNLYTSKDDT